MIAAFALTAALCTSPFAAPAAQDAPRPDAADRTAEDVETMRRLLVKELGEVASPGVVGTPRKTGFFTVVSSFGASSSVEHSDGFHVPGMGALFTLELTLPTRELEAEPDAEEQEPRDDDEWEAARLEALGVSKRSPGSFEYVAGTSLGKIRELRSKRFEIDPEAIDRVVDGVLRTLGRHGRRIRGLGQNDSITVALRLRASSDSPLSYVVTDTEAGDDDAEPAIVNWSTPFLIGANTPDQRVVVRLRLSDLAGYIDDLPDSRDLRQRALVHRY